MNYLKRRQAELNAIARELLALIEEDIRQGDDSASWSWPYLALQNVDSIEPIQLTPKTPRKFAAIQRLIRNHVEAVPLEEDDLEVLLEILNEPIEELFRAGDSSQRKKHQAMTVSQMNELWEGIPRDTEWIERSMSLAKFAAEQLLVYLNCFRDDPRLVNVNPIALCHCEAIFFKRRSNQVYCSDKCRHDAWRRKKKKEDPRYYANKARISRAVIKAQKKAKEQAKKRRRHG